MDLKNYISTEIVPWPSSLSRKFPFLFQYNLDCFTKSKSIIYVYLQVFWKERLFTWWVYWGVSFSERMSHGFQFHLNKLWGKPAPMKSCWHTHCVEQLCVTISPEVALYPLSLYSPEGLVLTFIVSLLSFWPVLLFQLCPVFKLPPVLRTTSCVFQCHAEKWRYEQSLTYPMTGHQHNTAELDHAVTDCILLPLGLAFAIVYSPRSPSVPQDTFLLSSQCGHAQRNSFSVLHHFHPSVF